MKIEEIKLIETEWKTERKFKKAGTLRLEESVFNFKCDNGLKVLQEICRKVDCNFHEVLDAVNRTAR